MEHPRRHNVKGGELGLLHPVTEGGLCGETQLHRHVHAEDQVDQSRETEL